MSMHKLVPILTVAALAASAPVASAADDIATSAVDLDRIYRGADGSALYTSAVGDKVVGYGEHPGTKLGFVFEGTRAGLTIDGRWWDIAKGVQARAGTLRLEISQGGSRLERDGGADPGPDSWQARSASGMKWAGRQEAGFQSTSATDLDGAFAARDGSRSYIRETSSDVVGVAERARKNRRPQYATVFIAERKPDGSIEGAYYDVPKGRAHRHGDMTARITGKPRTFAPRFRLAGPRARRYDADYAVDLDRFAQEIEQRLDPFVVGYGYGIAAGGKVVRDGGGGARRVPQPANDLVSPLGFSGTTVNETSSTSKTVTAVAVARVLEQHGISLDAKVDPYLPAQWARGPGMTTVTFRQLLAHAGLKHPGAVCGTDPYACLEQAVALGMTAPPGYNNVHYAIFRVILPFVTNGAAMTQLFALEPDTAARNLVFSGIFRNTVVGMLALGGVEADFTYPPSTNVAYRYAWGTPPTNEYFPPNPDEHFLEAGPGALKTSAIEYAQFLSGIAHDRFMSRASKRELLQDRLGFDDLDRDFEGMGDIGPLFTKNGGSGQAASQLMLYPGDVQVFITQNSTGNAAQPSNAEMLRDAWEAALK
jgi:hypothetical protein